MKKHIALWSLLFLGIASGRSASAASYAGDFSITNGNPNGQWTYGMTTLAAGYSLTPYTTSVSSGQLEYWAGFVSSDSTPGCYHNDSASDS